MSATSQPPTNDAHERILATAYELFSHRGIRAVGVDEIIETAGVAKATLYRHFRSKDDLVLAFLQRREDVWTHGWVEREARSRADDPEDQLLAIFHIFEEWFHAKDFEASVFINVLLEMGASHPTGQASVHYLENLRSVVAAMVQEAGLRDPEPFVRSWHILMQGSIVAAAEGDLGRQTRPSYGPPTPSYGPPTPRPTPTPHASHHTGRSVGRPGPHRTHAGQHTHTKGQRVGRTFADMTAETTSHVPAPSRRRRMFLRSVVTLRRGSGMAVQASSQP